MAAKKAPARKRSATPVEATVHQDKRANIPTADAQDFLSPEAEQPRTLLYPPDPSLDPQLVWKGKDEQDATNYNEESFFVRHCYFTGGNDPYDRLKRALKADIDEDAWETLYSTTSRPFPKPETGKIAVKVINDYGDEVMQVIEVSSLS